MLVNNYLNYIGSKDRYLPQILKFIERGAELTGGSLLIDLFCGSAVVGLNSIPYFEKVTCVDACKELITLHEWMNSSRPLDTLLAEVNDVIRRYELSKTNKEGFLQLRKDYNQKATEFWIEPSELYCLITHSFNYSLHTNKKGEFNVPFGANRSSFNKSLKQKFINWKNEIDKHPNIRFMCLSFDNLILNTDKKVVFFVDPPYSASISKHPYRVGNIKWGEEEDKKLLKFLDEQHEVGNLFVFTNVVRNNGVLNRVLFNWLNEHEAYRAHPVSITYNNCSYQRKNNGQTNEVIITNFN